jgi:hypothetical protein
MAAPILYYTPSGHAVIFPDASGRMFRDLGMPMEYKARFGARNISRNKFIELFRAAKM